MAARSTAVVGALLVLTSLPSLCDAFSSTLPKVGKHRARFDSMIGECNLPPATIEFIDSPQQRLLFKGKSRTPCYTFREYEINHGAHLHLVVELRGGGKVSETDVPSEAGPRRVRGEGGGNGN